MSYENPIVITHVLPAEALTGGVGVARTILGPEGKKGRLVGIAAVVTTDVTVAAASVDVGISDDTDKYGTLSVPISSAGSGVNNATINDTDANMMPADTVVEIGTDGAATAGAADLAVTIAWF